jgi:hypothetical protein
MDKGYFMKRSSRKDYSHRIHSRYRRASALERQRILDEFCANCGYHRKYAIRLLNGPPPDLGRWHGAAAGAPLMAPA